MSEFGISGLNKSFPGAIRENFIKNDTTELNTNNQDAPSVDGSSKSFGETLEGVLNETNNVLQGADKAASDLAAGRADSLHGVMIAMEKADLSLRTVNAVRNKMVEAYQEIMRMQV